MTEIKVPIAINIVPIQSRLMYGNIIAFITMKGFSLSTCSYAFIQFIQQLIADGRLKIADGQPFKGKRITFHDPCYLGRGNGEYAAPREALAALDADLVEMRRCKKNGLCCGAGGAQMFKDAEKGNREVNHERTDDVLETGAKVVATGCPFCNTMMTDGIKNAEREGDIEVKDIAELIAEAADLL